MLQPARDPAPHRLRPGGALRDGRGPRHPRPGAPGDRQELISARVLYRSFTALDYRAVDDTGQVLEVLVSERRDVTAARRFFAAMIAANGQPTEVVTDLAPALARAVEELTPAAFHNTDQYANNRVERDRGRLKARLRPMRGLKTDRGARTVISGHALIQNLRRGHDELGTDAHPPLRIAVAFDELRQAI